LGPDPFKGVQVLLNKSITGKIFAKHDELFRQWRRNLRLNLSDQAGGVALVSIVLLLTWGQFVRAQYHPNPLLDPNRSALVDFVSGSNMPINPVRGRVNFAAFSRDGSRIVSAGDDGTVRQWDAKTGLAIGEPLKGHQGWV
jgi:WD40 repeat protein